MKTISETGGVLLIRENHSSPVQEGTVIAIKSLDKSECMKLSAVVKYLGGLAHYIVQRKRLGIYEARLDRYEGSPSNHPPSDILMIRNIGHWSGDIDDKELTDKIGYNIEKQGRSGDILF